jgi:hypothetical protein
MNVYIGAKEVVESTFVGLDLFLMNIFSPSIVIASLKCYLYDNIRNI